MDSPFQHLPAGIEGRYRLERELGAGGMATVYLARDARHDRSVAVKVLRPEVASLLGPERFLREIQITAQLQHPNILSLIDSGSAPGEAARPASLYYVMPYVEGSSLRETIALRGPLPVPEAVRILSEITDALAYAHARGIVHRDIKPENVMLSGRHAVVMDFGIAKAVDEATGRHALTSIGIAVGTPAYMAPEQASGDPNVDHRVDIYALGIMAYEMLAGRTPFARNTAREIIAAQITATAPPLQDQRPGLPTMLTELVNRCLEKDPANRPQSATELLRSLEEVSLEAGALVPAARAWRRLVPGRRARMVLAAAAVVVASVGVWVSYGVYRPAPEPGPARLAVLAFESLGPEQHAHFIDGLVDEVRTQLAGLPDLRVIARVSSEAYRNTGTPVAEIVRELRVQYVLAGTVQWQASGGTQKIRVSPELIRDGEAIWKQSFDVELSDAFEVQSRIAGRVADALDLALVRREGGMPERPTKSAAAYASFLEGDAMLKRSVATSDDGRPAAALLQEATELDPSFGLAYARLSFAHSQTYWNGGDRTQERLSLATDAALRAESLSPALAETQVALGYVRYWGHRDYAGALEHFRRAQSTRANDVTILIPLGAVARREGRWDDAIRTLQEAAELDPRNAEAFDDLAGTLARVGRYDEAVAMSDRAVALSPTFVVGWGTAATIRIAAGDVEGARAILRAAESRLRETAPGWFFHSSYPGLSWAIATLLDTATRERLDTIPFTATSGSAAAWFHVTRVALALAANDVDRARRRADSAWSVLRDQIRVNPGEAQWHSLSALMQVSRGHSVEALTDARRAVELVPVSRDRLDGAMYIGVLAQVHAAAGNADSVRVHLEHLLRIPSFWSPAAIRNAPEFGALAGQPWFDQLVRR